LGLLDLLFPPRCAGCRGYGSAWCAACARAVEPIALTTLDGIPLIAGGRFSGPLQRAIHTYKYGGRRELGAVLAPLIINAAARSGIEFAAVGFVPLHAEKQKQRGFNQAERLAGELARALAIPVVAELARVRATAAQVGLPQALRRVNLLGSFAWAGAARPPAGLALVDDVCTTGATLEAAASAIREAGGSIAAFAVLARAQTLPLPPVTLPEQTACS
jgi:ComF family protein